MRIFIPILGFALFLSMIDSFRVNHNNSNIGKASLIQNIVNGDLATQAPFFVQIKVGTLTTRTTPDHFSTKKKP